MTQNWRQSFCCVEKNKAYPIYVCAVGKPAEDMFSLSLLRSLPCILSSLPLVFSMYVYILHGFDTELS